MMASSSSSSLARSWLYHVFLSFRGEDVRKGFLSHVLKEFKSKGINVFIDNEIRRGESVGPVLVGAIRQSRVAVVLLSRNYASSSWCLDELVEIMKCREEYQQTVLTIFYQVDPSDVKKQTGDFGKAFDKTCEGKTEEVKQAWRQALKDVACIAGYDFSNCGNEADLINKVASDVMAVVGFTPSKDFDDFVGIGARITEIKSKLIFQSENVKVIGIFGPAGIGKTTTARVLYNQLSPGFQFSTFLEDIRGSYEKPCGNDYRLKLRFQKNLLCQIFDKEDIKVHHLGRAQEMLSDKKVLVVLDEVDSWWQLEEMAKQRGWVGPGSVIIVTTEDRKLLKALGLGSDHIYKMNYPNWDESLQILCQFAFGQKYPDDGFESLAREVTWLAGDLPLGLRVMGSYLRGMSRDEWIEALPWLRSTLDREIESTLRFSYDALRDNERTLFLYLACFFVGFKVDILKSYFANSSLEVNHGLEVLVQKSLISIEEGFLAQKSLISIDEGFAKMHRLLEQMGREIVKKQRTENPATPHFLTGTDLYDVFEEDNATGNVLGIWWDTNQIIQVSKSAFQGMNNLQFLRFESDTVCTPEGLDCLPNKLRLLRWYGCPLRVWPSMFSGKFLVELIMQGCEFEMLWEGIKPLPCLRMFDLSHSHNLKKIPDLSEATSLEVLCLQSCKSLLELTSSIGNATKLYRLDISLCPNIKDFPNVSDSIVLLDLKETGIKDVPPWIENLFRLRKLFMCGCKKLKTISPNISKLENLEFLCLRYYSSCSYYSHEDKYRNELYNGNTFEAIIEWGPDFKRSWRLESDLDIHYILPICMLEKDLTSPLSLRLRNIFGMKTIPNYIRRLSGLIKLDVKECRRLEALPQLPYTILSIDAQGCESLKRIDSSSFRNPNICLNFANCFNLEQKARKLIQSSACKYAVLPGIKVPAHFTHRASSDSLTISLTPRPLPSCFRFKACILLSKVYDQPGDTSDDDADVDTDADADNDDEKEGENSLTGMSYSVRGKQNGLTVGGGSNQIHIPVLDACRKHLYILEDSFSLNKDCPEVEETTFSELTFVFRVHDKTCMVKGCGVKLLKVPHSILDGKETEDQECMGINIQANDESAGGEDEDDDEEDDSGDGCEEYDDDDDDEGGTPSSRRGPIRHLPPYPSVIPLSNPYGGEEYDDDDDEEDDSGDGGEEYDDEGGEDEDEDHVEDDEGGDGDNNKVMENDDVMPHSSVSLPNQSSPFSRGTPSSVGGFIRHMPQHPSAADPQSVRPFYGNPMHQGGDKPQTMLPVPQLLNPHSIPQQLPSMQLSQLQRPMQPPQHVRPSIQNISQPSEQGVPLQNQYQIPLHPMQMMQQTQVQPYYHPPQQQDLSHVQQGAGSSQRQESGMSLHDYSQSPEPIQALLSNREKLCELLEQDPKLMQMLQEKLGKL